MHAGSGLRNKLNLTSSMGSRYGQAAVIYYVFTVWMFVKRKRAFRNGPPSRYLARAANKPLICFMSLSCVFMASHRRSCQIGNIGEWPFFFPGFSASFWSLERFLRRLSELTEWGRRLRARGCFFFFFFFSHNTLSALTFKRMHKQPEMGEKEKKRTLD